MWPVISAIVDRPASDVNATAIIIVNVSWTPPATKYQATIAAVANTNVAMIEKIIVITRRFLKGMMSIYAFPYPFLCYAVIVVVVTTVARMVHLLAAGRSLAAAGLVAGLAVGLVAAEPAVVASVVAEIAVEQLALAEVKDTADQLLDIEDKSAARNPAN